jgi:hypothetical protein
MRKMIWIGLIILAAVGPLRSQTATQSQLSKDYIEIYNAKLHLGMTKAEVAEKIAGAQLEKGENDWLLHDGSLIQFENGRLAFASRQWNINSDVVDALFDVVSYFNNEGLTKCSVTANTIPDPKTSHQVVVDVECGHKSILIKKFTVNNHTYELVAELLGTERQDSEDRPR